MAVVEKETKEAVTVTRIPRILVVCNNHDTAALWGFILREKGLDVILERSPEQAIDRWSLELPDVVAIDMDCRDQEAYHIRSHLEDNRGASLMVRMPIGQKVSMARLIGTGNLLFSTGDAVDSPMVERGCRSKLTVKVDHVENFLENWSCGLHRVIFYGDHSRDLARCFRVGEALEYGMVGVNLPA